MEQSEAVAQPPTEWGKNLRCCMVCRLMKTFEQFYDQGCENCPYLAMEGDRERIFDCTTTEFQAKKVSKGRDKKLLRKKEAEKAQQLKAVLAELNAADNLLDPYAAFGKYDRNGLQALLRFYRSEQLPADVLSWALGLTKKHMQGLYEACPDWGWSDADKQQELTHADARYIIVYAAGAERPHAGEAAAAAGSAAVAAAGEPEAADRSAQAVPGPRSSAGAECPGRAPPAGFAISAQGAAEPAASVQGLQRLGQPLAFMHFRYEEEAGEPVLYLYEIQIEEQAQGKGLGKFLMQLLELVARKGRVTRLLLTVFHGNLAAQALYRRLGYVLDDDSPAAVDPASTATKAAEAALVCALDVEWPPDTHREHPSATLVQLALWSPQHGMHVLLLDMITLPRPAAKRFLQALFRNRQTLKVGYSLVMDLRAIASALGGEGGSCVAVVEPALDVGTVHRFLVKHRAPGVRRAAAPGLSGIVESLLGAPLDKQQQCSAWGQRPLAAEQLDYAVADAACLVAVLGALLRLVDPGQYPLCSGGELAAEQSHHQQQQQQGHDGLQGTEAALSLNRQAANGKSPVEGKGASNKGCPALGGCGCGAADAQTSGPALGSREGWMASGEDRLQEAVDAWGSRLELSGGQAARRRPARRSRAAKSRHDERQAELDEGFPVHVPWLDASRTLVASPRFICDVMTEGLARQLRMVGFDAESLAARDKTQRHAIYRCLVERAEEEGRVVLTRDQTFITAGYTYQAYLVRAETKQAQLQEVLRVFNLTVDEDGLLSRCGKCNGKFIPEARGPQELPQGHGVPEGIRAHHEEFWVCAQCQAVYWKGNQYGHAMERLSGMLASLNMR
ncbi:hypothetical protein N2152v2_008322 [Parachlorella kessleri]